MSEIESEIRETLAALKRLLGQIEPLRVEVASLQTEMAQVQREYTARLGELDRERSQLESEQRNLNAQLEDKPPPPPRREPTPDPIPPPPVGGSAAAAAEMVQRLREDPRSERKKELANHLFIFIDEDEEALKLTINQALEDPEQDAGHILERLAWGPIWEASPDWEDAPEQLERLRQWQRLLQERLSFWQRRRNELETDDPRAGLWREWRRRDGDGWTAYLDDQAAQQERMVDGLRQAVALLRRRYQDRQARAGGDL